MQQSHVDGTRFIASDAAAFAAIKWFHEHSTVNGAFQFDLYHDDGQLCDRVPSDVRPLSGTSVLSLAASPASYLPPWAKQGDDERQQMMRTVAGIEAGAPTLVEIREIIAEIPWDGLAEPPSRAREKKEEKLISLLHHIDPNLLEEVF